MTQLGRIDFLVSIMGILAYTGRKKAESIRDTDEGERPQRKTRARKASHQRKSRKGIECVYLY